MALNMSVLTCQDHVVCTWYSCIAWEKSTCVSFHCSFLISAIKKSQYFQEFEKLLQDYKSEMIPPVFLYGKYAAGSNSQLA